MDDTEQAVTNGWLRVGGRGGSGSVAGAGTLFAAEADALRRVMRAGRA